MLDYHVVCVCRRARDPLLAAAEDYSSRLSHYAKVRLIYVKEGTLESEWAALSSHLRPRELVVALDERGQSWTTQELASQLQRWERFGTGRIAFLVGGPDGLHPRLKERADHLLALSRFTLPHRLAQVVLLEQLYRGHTILRGERYHRA